MISEPLLVSGCSQHPATGTIVGQYRLTGGPAPGLNQPVTGTIWVYPGVVELSGLPQAKPITQAQAGADGDFSVSLKPGTFSLIGSGQSTSLTATSGCGGPVLVDVKASSRTNINVVCSVP